MNLQQAIETVLINVGKAMTPKQIAEEINETQIYVRSDKSSVPEYQITERIKNNKEKFYEVEIGKYTCKITKTSELLRIAWNLNDKIWKNFGTRTLDSTFLILLIFGFKRFVDNSIHFEQILGIKLDGFDFNIISFNRFTKELDSSTKLFKAKLDINDFDIIEEVFIQLQEKDFSLDKYSHNDFGVFATQFIEQAIKNGKLDIFMPDSINKLIYQISADNLNKNTTLYFPNVGNSSIAVKFAQENNTSYNFYGDELNSKSYNLTALLWILNNIKIENLSQQDAFANNKKAFADIIISTPPFFRRSSDDKSIKQFEIESKDNVVLAIQDAIKKLKNNGKAFILVKEALLFGLTKDFLNIRKKLVDEKLLEAVISLPTDIFKPYSGIKSSILVLSKKDNKDIIFINAAKSNLFSKDESGEIIFDSLRIKEAISCVTNKAGVNEPKQNYGKKETAKISLTNIDKSEIRLNADQYLRDDLPDNKEYVKLASILKAHQTNRVIVLEGDKIFNISDLNANYYDLYLDTTKYSLAPKDTKANLITKSVILISSVAPNIKASLFSFTDKGIIISQNIHAFEIDTNVNPEYLVFELNKDYVLNQIEAFSTGTTSLKRINKKQLLDVQIELPELDKQNEIVKIQKELLYTDKLSEAIKFAEKSGITGAKEKEILGFVSHEFGNILGGVASDILNLRKFLENQTNGLQNRINNKKGASTLNDVFVRLQNNMNDLDGLNDNLKAIIDFGQAKLSKEECLYADYISEQVQKHSNLLSQNSVEVQIHHNNTIKTKNKSFYIDKDLFAFVIRNFIINSVKHGFDEKTNNPTITFNLNEDKDFYYLSLINNGKPFPQSFSLEDFLSFGGRMDNRKGSGLGGFLFGKVVSIHEGTIEMIESEGVHFLISFPKLK